MYINIYIDSGTISINSQGYSYLYSELTTGSKCLDSNPDQSCVRQSSYML